VRSWALALLAACSSSDGRTAACGLPEPGNRCRDATTVEKCDGALVVTVDCAAEFAICAAPSGTATCTTECALQGVTVEGGCVDNDLLRCDFSDGAYHVVRAACAACGTDLEIGGASCLPVPDCGALCMPSDPAGARVVAGTVRYQDRPLGADGLLGLTPAPARGVAVAVIDDASGAVLAVAATGDTGAYSLRYDAADGATVHVLAVSTNIAAGRPVRVLRPDATLHGYPGPSFAAAASATVDLLVTEASGAAEAFNLVDVAVATQDVIRADLAVADPARIDIVWAKGASPAAGTSTDPATRVIELVGGLADDDGYDDSVLAHELGHFVELSYGRTSNPLIAHHLYEPESPPLAWSEGFASYFGGRVRGDPVYYDSNAAGGVRFDLASDVTPFTGGDQLGAISENTVGEILWRLDDHDAMVDRVEPRWLRTAPDRGAPGVDLVDFLDGWLVVDGAATCPALRAALASRAFPYDFAGPVGCP
jgi:hypothetical protein